MKHQIVNRLAPSLSQRVRDIIFRLVLQVFSGYGLPLEIYVDKAGFFRGEDGALTQHGKRLKFYDISFVFANSPESKGKVERIHLVWQDRLPAYFEREH